MPIYLKINNLDPEDLLDGEHVELANIIFNYLLEDLDTQATSVQSITDPERHTQIKNNDPRQNNQEENNPPEKSKFIAKQK